MLKLKGKKILTIFAENFRLSNPGLSDLYSFPARGDLFFHLLKTLNLQSVWTQIRPDMYTVTNVSLTWVQKCIDSYSIDLKELFEKKSADNKK